METVIGDEDLQYDLCIMIQVKKKKSNETKNDKDKIRVTKFDLLVKVFKVNIIIILYKKRRIMERERGDQKNDK
ncbi:UNVERIFIED_CONTAM: hypothetical protein DVV46_11240 [Lactobacillus paragasseri]|nr:hypothetical protein [Lactobacillus paragasseri]